MKKLWQLIQYYYLWQPIVFILLLLGLFMFVLKIPAFLFGSDNITFALGLGALSFIFIIPFCSGSTALRGLIANPNLAMVPGIRVQAGLAHMLIAAAASVYLYINFQIFSGNVYSPLVILRAFSCFSLFAGFMQFILPSRYFVPLISFLPFLLAIVLLQFRDLAGALFLDPVYTFALFIVCLAGWAWGLYLLKTRTTFRNASAAVHSTEAWATYDGGFLTQLALGKPRSPEGTLLLGYPDNWWSIVLRVGYYYVITPLVTTLGMFIVGITEQWERPMMENLAGLFLMISLFSAVFCVFIYGELVPRARLIWLRYGTDRQSLWRQVDYYCLRLLLLYYSFAVVITGLAYLLTDTPVLYLGHYLVIIISFCGFNLYFSMLVRAWNLSPIVLVLVLITTIIVLLAGLAQALSDQAPDFRFLAGMELLLFGLGLTFRRTAKQSFAGIDWKLVALRKTAKFALTQE